jgi:hypothetical protein
VYLGGCAVVETRLSLRCARHHGTDFIPLVTGAGGKGAGQVVPLTRWPWLQAWGLDLGAQSTRWCREMGPLSQHLRKRKYVWGVVKVQIMTWEAWGP